MRFRSLRSRLLVLTLLTLGAGLGILVATGNILLASTVASDNSQRLAARLDAQVAALSQQHGDVRVRDTLNDVALDTSGWVFVDGRLIEGPSDSSATLNRLAARIAMARAAEPVVSGDILLGRRRVTAGGASRTVASVVAGIGIGQLESLRRAVLIGSIALALVVLGGAGLAIRRVLSAALAAVDQMTRHAEEWEAHDLDRRFDLGPPHDEIMALAATLDHLLSRIAASRRHEQRFAAEVAHELRTPLAAIRGSAELAVGDDGGAAQIALSDIVSHSQRMATTLDTLIAYARRETTPAADGVDLAGVVATFPGVTLQVPGGPVPAVEGEPRLIRQVLAPLIENAQRHATAVVTVELAAVHREVHAIVRDDGPGVDRALGVKVFLPGVRGDDEEGDGAGLGLPLALRLARSCGGEIRLGAGPGGCFVVVLPVAQGVAPVST